MASVNLYPYQLAAVKKMRNGCILNGGVGSGKSITALAYYYIQQGGIINTDRYVNMVNPKDLYIITTARKRDTFEWDEELLPFLLSTDPKINGYGNKVVIDSWNNIGKYVDVKNAFFIFDEQRVVGSGAWVKSFLKIAKQRIIEEETIDKFGRPILVQKRYYPNDWVLLSATPGDTWIDYIPVFVANGFYKNRTEFIRNHVIYKRFSKFPQVDRYFDTGRLVRLRNRILVNMDFQRKTVAHHEDLYTNYDIFSYKKLLKTRQDLETGEPFKNAAEFCQGLRKLVNTSDSRQLAVLEIFEKHPRVIIFYNYDYELELLKGLVYGVNVEIAEWNGHKHQPIPESDSWVYLVQYNAGAEGWNCIKTDTIIFYSQNYSYKIMAQASGRIDRLNTPYTDLYYYHLKSHSSIDLAISKALKNKKKFNESAFAGK